MHTRNSYLIASATIGFILSCTGIVDAAPGIGGVRRDTLHVTPTWNPAISGWTWTIPVDDFWFDADHGHSMDAMLEPPVDSMGEPSWSTGDAFQVYQEIEFMPPTQSDGSASPLTFWHQAWVKSSNHDSDAPATWSNGAISSQWADPIGMGRPAPELFHDVAMVGEGDQEFWFVFDPVAPPQSADETMIARIRNGFTVQPGHSGPLRVRAFAIPEPQGQMLAMFALGALVCARYAER